MSSLVVKKEALNPRAPEFQPHGYNFIRNSSIIFQTPTHSPVPAPVMMVYYNHHHLVSSTTAPPITKPYLPYYEYYSPKTDESLGLIASPTSPLSPSFVQSPKTHGNHYPIRHKVRRSKLIWVKKNPERTATATQTETPTSDVADDDEDALPIASYPFGDCTSLMIRNIPVRLSRSELMGMLDDHCRVQNQTLPPSEPASQFDFLYLPIDFKLKGNLGYAFVNFTSWEGASRLYNSWKGSNWEKCSYSTKKICQIYPAKFQGEELKKRFETSVFKCESQEYLPVKIQPPRDGLNGDLTQATTIGTWIPPYTLIA